MTSADQPALTLPTLLNWYRDLVRNRPTLASDDLWNHIHHSVALDGCSLTLAETRTLLEKGLTAGGRPLAHHLMLVDYQKAQQQMLHWATEREPLNRARIQAVAAMLMHHTGGPMETLLDQFDTSKGEFRPVSAIVGSRPLMDARKVTAAVDKLLKEINSALPAVKTMRQVYDLSFQAHHDLMRIHPFGEGNGRVARLLMNYIQLYQGLPLCLVYAEAYPAYSNALSQSEQQSFPKPFYDFMYDQLLIFLKAECERLA